MTATSHDPNLAAAFRRQVAIDAAAPALVIDDDVWTRGELAAKANGAINRLLGLGLHAGDRVIAQYDTSADDVALAVAAAHLGLVLVPVPKRLGTLEINHLMQRSQASLFAFHGAAPPAGIRPPDGARTASTASITAQDDTVTSAPVACTDVDRSEVALIGVTSGSTGQPKGVMHSFRTMISVADGLQQLFPVSSDERMLSYLPLAHVAERAAVETQSLYYGFHLYFANSLDTFQEDLQRARPTLFFSVPRLWMKFYLGVNAKLPPKKQKLLFSLPIISGLVKKKALKQLGLDYCRAALTGAAPLSADIVNWYRNLGLELLEVYGMSENFGYSHANRPGQARAGSVGMANPGVEHRIGEGGEVQVKSPGQMLGYYKNEEKTKEDLTEDGFLKTGDMGEIDRDGTLRITGRVKDLFKTSKGKYVVPVPIENRFNHPKAEVVCVAGANQPQPCLMVLLSLLGA